jgi:lathosterol oxidase
MAVVSDAVLAWSPAERVAPMLGWLGFLTAFGLVMGYAMERHPWAKPIWAVPLAEGQLAHELKGNAMYHLVAALAFGVAVGTGLITPAPPSWWTFGLTLFSCWAWFELWFYVMHRGFHTRPLIRFHAWHHVSRVTTPLSGFSMSWGESIGWQVGYLLPPVVLSALSMLNVEGWLLYLWYHWSGNIMGHANVEVIAGWIRVRALSWGLHPFVYHALHHARWNAHYGLYTTFLDRLLGTEWEDWPELHRRVWAGEPLTSLTARGDRLEPPS